MLLFRYTQICHQSVKHTNHLFYKLMTFYIAIGSCSKIRQMSHHSPGTVRRHQCEFKVECKISSWISIWCFSTMVSSLNIGATVPRGAVAAIQEPEGRWRSIGMKKKVNPGSAQTLGHHLTTCPNQQKISWTSLHATTYLLNSSDSV